MQQLQDSSEMTEIADAVAMQAGQELEFHGIKYTLVAGKDINGWKVLVCTTEKNPEDVYTVITDSKEHGHTLFLAVLQKDKKISADHVFEMTEKMQLAQARAELMEVKYVH